MGEEPYNVTAVRGNKVTPIIKVNEDQQVMQNTTLKESLQKSYDNGITEDHLSFLGTFNVPETNSFLECTSENLG